MKHMSDLQTSCPQCGARLKRGLAGNLCLNCLLSFGLKEGAVPSGGDEAAPIPGSPEIAPDEFDRFRIIEKIGEGGCGIVYRAEQLQPVRREVALKVIKLGLDTASVIARFGAERQALALMDHPGIARVFDAGSSRSGRPFFVMELVAGERITDFCDQRRLSIAQRLELFARVCEAVQHAHQKGIIHRDLKPSNILVVEHDGVAQPKVIDFGIAKATSRQRLADQTIYTAFDQFIGTPAYMSPEQAGATGEDVDTRSDIYSLGVLLYELLTGRPPFEPERLRQAAVDEIFRIIRDEDPARPSARLTTLSAPELSQVSRCRLAAPPKLLREVRGDLDWVVMKALEKLPARRYETANALAVEIRRHLNDEPVLARPPSGAYRFRKMVRRNQLAVGASAAVLVALIAGLMFSTWRFLKEKEARRDAVAAEQKARAEAARAEQVARLLKDMLAGVGPSVALGRDTTMLREILDRTAKRVGRELKDHPDIEAQVRTTIGNAYAEIGALSQAEAMHRESLRLRETYFGPTHGAVVESLLGLSSVLSRRSGAADLVEGEAIGRRAVAIEENRSRQDQASLANALEQLAWNYSCQARWAEAEPLYRRVLDMRRRFLGTPETFLVNSLSALSANLCFSSNKLDEAESLIREALAIEARRNLEASPTMADLLHTLSLVLERRQKLPEATEAIRESIRLRHKLWGEGNVAFADPLARLAQVLVAGGKLAEAETALRECINILTKAYGTENLRLTERYLGTLTELFHRQKKWPEAEASVQEWVALCRAKHGTRKTLFHALRWQEIILIAQRKWTEAEPVLREVTDLCDRLSTGDQPSIEPTTCIHLRRGLGEALFRQGKMAEAEPLLLSSYEALQHATGPWDGREAEWSLQNLVEIYEATARPNQAAAWKQKLVEFQQAQGPKEPPNPGQ